MNTKIEILPPQRISWTTDYGAVAAHQNINLWEPYEQCWAKSPLSK